MFDFVEYNLKRIWNLVGLTENEVSINGDDDRINVTMDLKRFTKTFDDVGKFEDIRAIVISWVSYSTPLEMVCESMNYNTYEHKVTFGRRD